MLKMDQVGEFKRLHAQGIPLREISRRLGASRTTLNRYQNGAMPGEYSRTAPTRTPAQSKIYKHVKELLEEEMLLCVPKKQRLTAARVHRILEEKGIVVSVRTTGTVMKSIRHSLRDPLKHAFLPLEYEPSRDGQVDFFEAIVRDENGNQRKVFVLIVRASFSSRAFRYAAPNQTREALLEGLMQALEFFGGVFHNLWFDNLTPAVRTVLKGRNRVMQKEFQSFANYYGFVPQFCSPGKGNEKGGVEKDVQYSRSEGFTPMPVASTRKDVQELMDHLAVKDLSRTTKGKEKSIGELWRHEISGLIPLPMKRFVVGKLIDTKVSNRSWVQSGTNFYSVPVKHVSTTVQVRMNAETVEIFDRHKLIAKHTRIYGRFKMSFELEHYLPLLERKHRGVDRAAPVRHWLNRAQGHWRTFLRELRQEHGEVEGSKQFVEALELGIRHDFIKMNKAMCKTLASGRASTSTLRYFLGMDNKHSPSTTFEYDGPKVKQGPLAAYGEVLNA